MRDFHHENLNDLSAGNPIPIVFSWMEKPVLNILTLVSREKEVVWNVLFQDFTGDDFSGFDGSLSLICPDRILRIWGCDCGFEPCRSTVLVVRGWMILCSFTQAEVVDLFGECFGEV
jgi:hypothetical protein